MEKLYIREKHYACLIAVCSCTYKVKKNIGIFRYRGIGVNGNSKRESFVSSLTFLILQTITKNYLMLRVVVYGLYF